MPTPTKVFDFLSGIDYIDKTVLGLTTGAKIGGIQGAIIGGIVGAVWDMLESAQPTDPYIKFIPEPQKPTYKDIPRETPEHKCRPVPRKIYLDPPIDTIAPPTLPDRILPVDLPTGTSSNTEATYTSNVKASLLNQKFGCILARPLVDATLTLCEPAGIETANVALTAIADGMEADVNKIQDLVNEDKADTIPSNATAFIAFYHPLSTSHTYIVGTQWIDYLYSWYYSRTVIINSFPNTGLIYADAQVIPCSEPPTTATSTVPVFLDDNNNDSECAVPITMFDELEGYKADQLQIIWRNHDWATNRKPRTFTLPNPIEIDALGSALDGLFGSFTFGSTLIEIWLKITGLEDAIRPIQKCKIYTDFKTKDECKEFVEGLFTEWLSAVTTGVTVKDFYPIFFDDEDYYVGECNPHRAVLMGWDKDRKHWCKKADWLLNKPTP